MYIIKKIFIKNKIILGIDTSFDDTSCAILKGNKILSNIIYNQKIHNMFNGVKPNISYDLHLKKIYNIVKKSIYKSKININKIDAIAYTKGPGLIGSLMIGEHFSKSMALALNIPLISVNHIHGHIYSIFLYNKEYKYPMFPYLCLSISGGHTKLFIIKNFFKIKTIGKTLDENLGVLFDKFSILLGFKYTEGPNKIYKYSKYGKFNYKLPIPNVSNLNFSFSGLITFLKNKIVKNDINKYDLCRSFLETIFIILKNKIEKAIIKTNIKNIFITGGVSCNKFLKKKFIKISNKKKWNIYFNKNKKNTKDNGAMIALIGQIKYRYKLYNDYKTLSNSHLNINIL
ncbi:MAG: tRNA (adenosine(37)-N6)-threonylcarbamoyltransferase complex transferase subunit TsaD [Candidatus Shikimatogenerans sp. JK-2022]|nr:tRNA (adenosine(37)-N6)-threonylcarbamoyltransferase complex transferase subunit TsaD [Candidatus Shikimatogenerans bostrichidophilus]